MGAINKEPYIGGVFSEDQKKNAWNAGMMDRLQREKSKEKAFESGIQTDDVTAYNLEGLDRASVSAINKVYKKLGSSLRVKANVYSKSGKSVGGATINGGREAIISASASHKGLKGAERTRYFAFHEAIHVLAQTEKNIYNSLKESLEKIKPELFSDENINAKKEEYKKIGQSLSDESAREELLAEYIGEALAKADRKTIHQIIGDRRNVAEVLLDLVNKLIDLFREDKELREGYKKAREAIIEAMNNIDREREDSLSDEKEKLYDKSEDMKKSPDNTEDGVKYAASDKGAEKITEKDVAAIQSIGRKSVNEFTSKEIKKTEAFAIKYFKEMGVKSPFFRAWFGDWRANDTTKVTVANQKGTVRGKIKNHDTGWEVQISRKVFDETKAHGSQKAKSGTPYLDYINSIVENAVLLDSYAIPENKAKSPNSVMMHSLYAVADMGNGPEILKLYIEELNDVNADGTMKRAYQLQNIENQQSGVIGSGNSLSHITQTADIDTIADLFAVVKQKDKNFNPKEVNPAFLNEDGTPRIVYHGTNYKFWTFDKGKFNENESSGDYVGEAFFFSKSKETARKYGSNVMAVYLDIKNPLIINSEEDAKNFRDTFLGMYTNGDAELRELIGADYDYFSIMEENPSKIREELQKRGYDGLIDNLYGQYAVFSPNQIKSATENIGTFDGGNEDIRYAASDSESETGGDEKKKEKYFPMGRNRARDVKIVAETENGKTTRFIKTVAESQFTPDEVADDLLNVAKEGRAAYETYSDKAALSKANNWFESKEADLDAAADEVEAMLENDAVHSKDNFAKAQLVINKLLEAVKNESDRFEKERLIERAEKLIIDTALAGTRAGQAVQAMSMIKKLSPEGRLIALKKGVKDLNEERSKKSKKKSDPQTEEQLERQTKRSDNDYKEKARKYKSINRVKEKNKLEIEILLEAIKSKNTDGSLDSKIKQLEKELKAERYAADDTKDTSKAKGRTEDHIITMEEAKAMSLEELFAGIEERRQVLADIKDEWKAAKEELRIARIGREILEEFKNKIRDETDGKELVISKELEEEILEAKNAEDLDKAMNEATLVIARQIPARIGDRKWRTAWRYMCMLLNPTTHERNVLSNTAMYFTVGMKDIIAGAISDVAYIKDKDGERYNSLIHRRTDKETRKWLKETVWEETAPYIEDSGQGKTKDNYTNAIMRAVRPFVFKITNKIYEFNSWFLDWQDNKFIKKNFVRAMERYMAANNLTKESISENELESAKAHAIQEAKEATFHDVNELANKISKINKKHPLVGEIFFGGNIPFLRTPFNLARRGLEYSPLEFLGAVNKKNKYGSDYTKADMINDVSKGITGAAMVGLGMLFYSIGFLHVSGGDDDEYEREKGEQNFAIRFGKSKIWGFEVPGFSYTIDWLQPSCIPFLSGALIMKQIEDEDLGEDSLSFGDVIKIALNVTEKMFEPLIQCSVLSGLDEALEAVRSSEDDSDTFAKLIKQTLFNYSGQYVPTVVSKIVKSFDPSTRRTVFAPADSKAPELEYFAKKQMGKLPGLSRLNPEYVDLFGETAKRKEGGLDYTKSFLYNMLSPGYFKVLTEDEADKELIRLSKTAAAGGKKVLNYKPGKKISIDKGDHTVNRALNEEEYFEIKKKMGQFGTKALRYLVESDVYREMSDEARAEATDFIWNCAERKAKAEVIDDFYMSKEERIADTIAGGDAEHLALWAATLAKERIAEDEAHPPYTEEQQMQYDNAVEETYSALSKELSDSSYFNDTDDLVKREALKDLYSYSVAKARSEIEEGYKLKGKNKKFDALKENTSLSPADYLAFEFYEKAADSDGNGSYKQEEINAALYAFGRANGASEKDLAYLWQVETDGVSSKNPYGAYLDSKFYKSSKKDGKTWEK